MCEQVCVRERENESKHDCNEECVCVCVRAQGNVCMRVGGIECVKGFRNPRPMLNFLNKTLILIERGNALEMQRCTKESNFSFYISQHLAFL